jgi:hypothetical protein
LVFFYSHICTESPGEALRVGVERWFAGNGTGMGRFGVVVKRHVKKTEQLKALKISSSEEWAVFSACDALRF